MRRLWVRRATSVLIALIVLAACGVAATMALDSESGEASARRDESQFLSHVKEFFGGEIPEPVGVADAVYIAEGDHACRWLAREPAVTGTASDQQAYGLFREYLRREQPIDGWTLGRGATSVRGSVVYDAWNYLCPHVRDTRVWTAPPEYGED